jgi:hypothetical protein
LHVKKEVVYQVFTRLFEIKYHQQTLGNRRKWSREVQ